MLMNRMARDFSPAKKRLLVGLFGLLLGAGLVAAVVAR